MLNVEGLTDFDGRLSLSTADNPEHIRMNLCQISRNGLTANDIVRVDMRGKLIGSGHETPSEMPIHTAIYRQRKAVVSVAQRPIVPVFAP